MSKIMEVIGNAVHHAHESAHNLASAMMPHDVDPNYVDLEIQFIEASALPKMDVVGKADPYFIAKLDDKLTFVSSVKVNTETPVWNESWKIKNVPVTAVLNVRVMDKDNMQHDDYIGKFSTPISAGARNEEITGPGYRHASGIFSLRIDSTPSRKDPEMHSYLFDGPIRYSRHFSPTVGLLTRSALDQVGDNARLYSTWKVYPIGVPLFFGDTYQHWNVNYKAAQEIFQGPRSIVVRSGIQAAHRMLYARNTTNGFGLIDNTTELIKILHGGSSGRPQTQSQTAAAHAERVKPAVYTYVIAADDDSFRFSETGAAFFVDFASKHALHSNCNEHVRYSGEFHPRPHGGWDNFSDSTPDDQVKWELVIDNNSGTYSPDKKMLPVLQALLEHNFPGFAIFALDREDEELVKSREACRAYALKHRGVKQEDLQPHAVEGEVTLQKMQETGKGSDPVA